MSKVTDYLVELIRGKDEFVNSLMNSQRTAQSEAWDKGWAALAGEYKRQRDDPNYPIGRDVRNPYHT